MSYVDCVLLVVKDVQSSSEQLQHAMHVLEQTNLPGLVLNKSAKPTMQ
jgi:hypothetical protein